MALIWKTQYSNQSRYSILAVVLCPFTNIDTQSVVSWTIQLHWGHKCVMLCQITSNMTDCLFTKFSRLTSKKTDSCTPQDKWCGWAMASSWVLDLMGNWRASLPNALAHLIPWGQVTHKCVSKLCHLLITPLGTNFSIIKIAWFWLKKMHLKTSSAKWQPFCLGLNVFRVQSCASPLAINYDGMSMLKSKGICLLPIPIQLIEPAFNDNVRLRNFSVLASSQTLV